MTQQTLNKHYYKHIGICPNCRRERLIGDEKSCPECRAKAYAYRLKRDRDRYNQVHAIWSKKTYADRKAKGLCTRCGKRKAKQGQFRCEYCISKDSETRRIRNCHLSRYERGVCRWCDNPIEKGFKVCEYHHMMNATKSKKRGTENAENCTTM